MSDNLFERLTDLSIGTGSQTPLAAIDRIKELEAKLAKALGAMQGVRLLMFEDQHKDAFRLLDSTLATLKRDEP